jgi:YidC/Oxa1 family membrane protein insertase
LEQPDLQKRLLLALVLSFIVFIGYSYLFPPQAPAKTEQTQTAENDSKASPEQKNTPASPSLNSTNAVAKHAPQSTTTSIATIKSDDFIITVDEFGRLAQMELLKAKYRTEDGKNLRILGSDQVKPLELRFSDTKINEEAFATPYQNQGPVEVDVTTGAKTVTLVQNLSTLTVTKKITFKRSGQYKVDISTSAATPYFITPGYRPVADQTIYMLVRGALVKGADDIITTIEDGDAEGHETFKNATIASAFDRYYASLFYDFEQGMDVSVLKVAEGNPLLFVKADGDVSFTGYIGPKEYKVLHSINPELTDAIEFGWFTFLATPFFKVLLWINDYVGNWGWAIIIFTILIKMILFPLSYKGMMSMQKLKDLAPKMKELKEKYGKDPAKMNAQMMELYGKHGANPMGGCLPLLLQIPIFFALYRVLLNADELQGAEWIFWIHDLAVMDPYFILPILMGVTMWYQQKITPANFTDPMQEKIFKWFPVIMTVFFVYFPSGLVLYWLINNIFTIGQQYYINHAYAKQKEMAKEAHSKK